MANLFNSIRIRPPKANRFNLSHDVKLTCKFGKLTPILCQDVLPGDVFKLNTEMLVRFAPMLAPVMHRVNVYTHFFFVPKRLVWDNWKQFITGGESGEDSPAYPRIKITSDLRFNAGSLADYLGFPVLGPNKGVHPDNRERDFGYIDALPFRAYQLIYNEYYRDQNLTEEVEIGKDMDGRIQLQPYISGLMQLRNRAWQKDYFTSALPFAQRGDEVTLPFTGDADLIYSDESRSLGLSPLNKIGINTGMQVPPVNDDGVEVSNGNLHLKNTNQNVRILSGPEGNPTEFHEPVVHLSGAELGDLIQGVDLSKVSSATINELRRAIRAQEFLEVAARGGSRYIEQIYAYFGVRSSDARLQRPEFLGGGKSPVVISDVLQTSQTTESSPQANPSGHAVSVQNSHSFKFRAEEHGYIIGIMSVMPKAAYQQGMPRMFQKFDRLDYYWPQFAHLGEQEITRGELFYDLSQAAREMNKANEVFGYTPRYAEYKFCNDSVHGDFRDSLAFWHMGRIFETSPALNTDFLTNVEDAANRVFAVQDSEFDKIWVNIHHNLVAIRLMPKFGTPLL